jgi:hypothetical protein
MDFQDLSEEEWLEHRQKETVEFLELQAQLALKKKQLVEQQLVEQQLVEQLKEQQQHFAELATEAERQHTEKQQWRLS